jgi:hypothetical protein
MIELEHSPLGGSAAHRFMNCEGSFLKQRELIEAGELENIESEYAKLGTAAHELGAKAIATETEPYEFLGEMFNGYLVGWPGGISLDAVQVYFSECMGIIARRKERGNLFVEQTIHLPEIHPLLRGTVDFGFWSMLDGIFLRDYKNGEGIGVSAPGNKQLLYYGYLMILKILADGNTLPREMRVSLGIVQPNFYGIFDAPDVWETTVGFVLDWGMNELLPRMKSLTEMPPYHMREDDVEDDFNPGEWCQFCPVLLDCPVMQKAFVAYAEAEEEFIAMLTDEDLDRFYGMREQARRFMKALETTVHHRLIGGSKITSAKLVEKKVNRVWKPGAAAALQAAFGDKAFTVPEVKSPAQIEKLSSRGKELALEYGYKPESHGLSVAPLSDPRPEAKPKTNAEVFKGHAQSLADAGF